MFASHVLEMDKRFLSGFHGQLYVIIVLVVAIAKCQRAKQKLEDDRTELYKYWELAL